MQLRDYQQEAISRIKWAMDLPGNDLISLPTGSGKSIVIAEVANFLNQDILILQPTKEILEQNRKKLMAYVDKEDIGVFSASMGEKVIKKYTFATIGSVYKVPERFAHFRLVLLDECHLLNPKSTGSMFGKFLAGMNSPKVVGLTATPYRIFPTYFVDYEHGRELYQATSIKIISRVQPRFWDRIIYNVNNEELTRKGYLCPLKYIDKALVKQELIPLNKSCSDYDIEKYDAMVEKKDKDIVEAIRAVAQTHRSVLVFCTSISQSERLQTYFPGSEAVSSKTKPAERDRIIESFKDGVTKIVFNVGVLTTGFDMPELDCIVLLRPTKSVALYYQMLGRGVRIAPGKTHCTVVDMSDCMTRIGGVESIKLEKVDNKWNVTTSAQPKGWHGVQLYKVKIKDLQPKQAEQQPIF